jgi:hypothetical protein
MREPSPWIAQLLALPIGAISAFGLGFLWTTVNVNWLAGFATLSLILWIIGIVVIHETIHAAFHPGLGTTSNTIVGFWPSKLLFYSHYDNVLSRKRFIVILLSPFVTLSLMPLMVALSTGLASFHVAFVSVFNALLSCVDVLGVFLLLTMVPTGARVRNRSWRTYYSMVDTRS